MHRRHAVPVLLGFVLVCRLLCPQIDPGLSPPLPLKIQIFLKPKTLRRLTHFISTRRQGSGRVVIGPSRSSDGEPRSKARAEGVGRRQSHPISRGSPWVAQCQGGNDSDRVVHGGGVYRQCPAGRSQAGPDAQEPREAERTQRRRSRRAASGKGVEGQGETNRQGQDQDQDQSRREVAGRQARHFQTASERGRAHTE